jgi:hypothetical protein
MRSIWDQKWLQILLSFPTEMQSIWAAPIEKEVGCLFPTARTAGHPQASGLYTRPLYETVGVGCNAVSEVEPILIQSICLCGGSFIFYFPSFLGPYI